MKKLFSLDSPIMRFLTKVGHMIVINFMWLLCSLPVVTYGAASCAMYRSMFDLREDKGNVIKGFFKAFAENFKIGTLCWLSVIGFGLIVSCIPQVAAAFGLSLFVAAAIALACAALLVLWLVMICLFPLAAYFENTLKKTLRNALFIAVKHRKQSIVSALFAAIPLFVFLIEPGIVLYTSAFWVVFFPGVTAYFIACRFAPIFMEYGNKREEKLNDEESEEV